MKFKIFVGFLVLILVAPLYFPIKETTDLRKFSEKLCSPEFVVEINWLDINHKLMKVTCVDRSGQFTEKIVEK